MRPGAKLSLYALALVAILGGGAAVGSAVGPVGVEDGSSDHGGGHAAGSDEDTPSAFPTGLPAGGLLVSDDGYTFQVEDRVLEAGRPNPLRFVIVSPNGSSLTDYERLHDRDLHLIVVSRDLKEFSHVHPRRDAQGVWSVELPALPAGGYRAYADFKPTGGRQLTLGIDVTVPGSVAAPGPLTERRTAEVDGYEVTLDGQPEPGGQSEVTITVRRDGEVVTTEPYLDAAGHLVAIRDGDLAYLHVHPVGDEPAGPVRFAVEAPSAGTYGLYFDFAHDGTVHTASFTVVVDDEASAGTDPGVPPTTGNDHDTDHGH